MAAPSVVAAVRGLCLQEAHFIHVIHTIFPEAFPRFGNHRGSILSMSHNEATAVAADPPTFQWLLRDDGRR